MRNKGAQLIYGMGNKGYEFGSEKLIEKPNKPSDKNLVSSSIEQVPVNSPQLRYSQNNTPNSNRLKGSQGMKSLYGISKSNIEVNTGVHMKTKSEMKVKGNQLNLTMANFHEGEYYYDNTENPERFESFGQLNDLEKPISNFSSFSNLNQLDNKISTSLIETFGHVSNKITIHLTSNWGSISYIGLTEIKLFDRDYHEIFLGPDNLKLYNKDKVVSSPNLRHLINNKVSTISQTDMLKLNYNPKQDRYTIEIDLPFNIVVAYMVVWNFNEDISKGVRLMTIIYQSKLVFEGELMQGNGKVSNCGKCLTVKFQKNLDDSRLIELLRKQYGTNKLLTPLTKPASSLHNTYGLMNRNASRELQRSNMEVSTPKNQIRGTSGQRNQSLSSNCIKKSNKNDEYFDSIRFSTNISFDSNSKLQAFRLNDPGSDNKNPKPQYSKLGPIIINKPQRLFASSAALKECLIEYKAHHIPELPQTHGLTIKLISNWGDKSFIGLCGIEVFDYNGHKLELSPGQLAVLCNKVRSTYRPGFEEKLLDEELITCDAKKHWVHPFDSNSAVVLKLRFDRSVKVALIRIWNYNCSRIHASKGVKECVISDYDDNTLLFAGQIRKASGGLSKPSKNFEPLIFTIDRTILSNIAKSDWFFMSNSGTGSKNINRKIKNCLDAFINERPTTSEYTEEEMLRISAVKQRTRDQVSNRNDEFSSQNSAFNTSVLDKEAIKVSKSLRITIIETWGNDKEFGFCGLDFYTLKKEKVHDDMYNIATNNKLAHHNTASIDKTLKSKHTLIFEYDKNNENSFEITFKTTFTLTYIDFFGIDDPKADNRKGIKKFLLFIDGVDITKGLGIYLKKNCKFDFYKPGPQRILFPIKHHIYNMDPSPSALMPISQPTGFTIEFHLKNTFGDPYYIGLNGIEIFDTTGTNIFTQANKTNFKLVANPPGVCKLPDMAKDTRFVTNLYKAKPYSDSIGDIWLAPFAKNDAKNNANIILVEFTNPISIGLINIWNYSRTPQRAVKEIDIYLDGNVVYSGWLNDVNERLLSSIPFSDTFMRQRNESIHIEKIQHLPKEITELYCEGQALRRKRSDKYLNEIRPTTGTHHLNKL